MARGGLSSVADWVRATYDSYDFEFVYDRQVFIQRVGKSRKELSLSELEDIFFLGAVDVGLGKQKDIIRAVLRQVVAQECAYYVSTITDNLCASPSAQEKQNGLENLRELIFLMTGKESPLDVAVMRHFFWQIKRKLLGREVVYHMMPFWYGAEQGSGKSTVLRRLIEPLQSLSSEQNFNVFVDARRAGAFQQYYALFLDEMGEASKADMSTIKAIISGNRMGHRRLFENNEGAIRINTTLIGAANRPLNELLKDDYMRRFWQINVQRKELITPNFPRLSALDYSAMWASVDLNEDCPILPHLSQIDSTQLDLTTKRLSARFLQERCDLGEDVEERVSGEDLYELYCAYCRELGVEDARWESKRTFLINVNQTSIIKQKINGLFKYRAKIKGGE